MSLVQGIEKNLEDKKNLSGKTTKQKVAGHYGWLCCLVVPAILIVATSWATYQEETHCEAQGQFKGIFPPAPWTSWAIFKPVDYLTDGREEQRKQVNHFCSNDGNFFSFGDVATVRLAKFIAVDSTSNLQIAHQESPYYETKRKIQLLPKRAHPLEHLKMYPAVLILQCFIIIMPYILTLSWSSKLLKQFETRQVMFN